MWAYCLEQCTCETWTKLAQHFQRESTWRTGVYLTPVQRPLLLVELHVRKNKKAKAKDTNLHPDLFTYNILVITYRFAISFFLISPNYAGAKSDAQADHHIPMGRLCTFTRHLRFNNGTRFCHPCSSGSENLEISAYRIRQMMMMMMMKQGDIIMRFIDLLHIFVLTHATVCHCGVRPLQGNTGSHFTVFLRFAWCVLYNMLLYLSRVTFDHIA